VAGGADDQAGVVFHRFLKQVRGERVDGEIDHAVRLADGGAEILARVMGGDDGDLRQAGGFDDGLAHAAGFSSDEEIWHLVFRYMK